MVLRVPLFLATVSAGHLAGHRAGHPQHPTIKSTVGLNSWGEYKGNVQREEIADEVAAEVKHDKEQDMHISDLFEDYEKSDKKREREVRGDRNLVALTQKEGAHKEGKSSKTARWWFGMGASASDAETKKTEGKKPSAQVPVEDIAAQIAAERDQPVDIHHEFEENEQNEAAEWRRVNSNRDMRALVQKDDGLTHAQKHELALIQVETLTDETKFQKDYGLTRGQARELALMQVETLGDDAPEEDDGQSLMDKFLTHYAEKKEDENMFLPKRSESSTEAETGESSDASTMSTGAHHAYDSYSLPHGSGSSEGVISVPLESQIQVSFMQKQVAAKGGIWLDW